MMDRAKATCLDDVKERLRRIGALAKAGDHEAARGREEELWRDVLLTAAKGGDLLAKAALKSRKIKFRRG